MPLIVSCKCGTKLRVADENRDKKLRCPACQAVIVVPPEAAAGTATTPRPAREATEAKRRPALAENGALRTIERIGQRYQDVGVQLDLQLRSTTRAHLFDAELRYDIDVATYESLRTAPPIPRILVLLVLPEEEVDWLSQSPEELIIRHCAYWTSLRGAEATTATSSVRIRIPRSQVFSAQAVQALMSRLAEGGLP
jgi:Domain of unknown function (DUF4365)